MTVGSNDRLVFPAKAGPDPLRLFASAERTAGIQRNRVLTTGSFLPVYKASFDPHRPNCDGELKISSAML